MDLYQRLDNFNDKKNRFIKSFVYCVLYAIFGLALGHIVAYVSHKTIISLGYNRCGLVKFFIEIMYSSFTLSLIYSFISTNFAFDWQNAVTGLFFGASFFGSLYAFNLHIDKDFD